MWRSNVLRSRPCSSARPLRHGLRARCYSSAGLPIGVGEFEGALASVLSDKWASCTKAPIGFAISGGVDSMALAALYAAARRSNTALPRAHGFIVDHRVRPESSDEAEWVAEQLRQKFGMEASVLPLTWPDGFDVRDHKRFETDARALRYQALGRACRAGNIPLLMVAHHADDQAETVMMRLMNNRLRTGLQGMRSIEWLPECYGMYGMHHSGQPQMPDTSLVIPFPIESGGIQIARPLLAFEKSRLIATCEAQHVPWVEDKTNHMQTYTPRNAIRHVFKNHSLPEALSIKSLVQLSLHMQKRVNAHEAYAQTLLDKCLIQLDIKTGSVLIRLPAHEALLDRPIETVSDANEAKNNAYYLLKHVADLVTPQTKAPLSQLAATMENIWPQFRDSEDIPSSEMASGPRDKAYCVYGTWWRWWGRPSLFEENAVSVHGFAKRPHHPREWLLTRQPPATSSAVDESDFHITYAPARTLAPTADSPPESTYQLFDGRYWIRLLNHTQDTLVLRLFSKHDMRHIPPIQHSNRHLGPRPERFIATAFGELKPKDIRFTLPAVFRIDTATGEESLVGFPTLDISMHTLGAPATVCEWGVRYKKIKTGSRTAGDIVVPGITHAAINSVIANQNQTHAQSRHRKPKAAARNPRPPRISDRAPKMQRVLERPSRQTLHVGREGLVEFPGTMRQTKNL